MLRLDNVYTDIAGNPVLRGVSLNVKEGEIVALLGRNGVGKTTTLRTIMNLWSSKKGDVFYNQKSIVDTPTYMLARSGIAYVPEYRGNFNELSVYENLAISFYGARKNVQENIHRIYQLFPRLEERSKQPSGTLSGGERQMLALGKALISDPKMLLVDEPTQGLAPQIVSNVMRTLYELSQRGLTVLLVEQNLYAALSISQRFYVMEKGQIVYENIIKNVNDSLEKAEARLGLDNQEATGSLI